MMSYPECNAFNGVWMRSGTINMACSEDRLISVRPCCIGHRSSYVVNSREIFDSQTVC